MLIPRPCAYKSVNLTSVSYYRGQDQTAYKIGQASTTGNVVTMMDQNSVLVYQNGLNASDIAVYDWKTYSVLIQTDSEEKVAV